MNNQLLEPETTQKREQRKDIETRILSQEEGRDETQEGDGQERLRNRLVPLPYDRHEADEHQGERQSRATSDTDAEVRKLNQWAVAGGQLAITILLEHIRTHNHRCCNQRHRAEDEMRGHAAEGVTQDNVGKTNPQNSRHDELDDADDKRQQNDSQEYYHPRHSAYQRR